jgi:hypothetical protein
MSLSIIGATFKERGRNRMKFNPIILDGQHRVSAGRGKIFRPVFADEEQACAFAVLKTALFHIEEAEKLVSYMVLEDAMMIGHIANDIISEVADRAIDAGEASEMDPRGWLA